MVIVFYERLVHVELILWANSITRRRLNRTYVRTMYNNYTSKGKCSGPHETVRGAAIAGVKI